jgi:hypothetical protein
MKFGFAALTALSLAVLAPTDQLGAAGQTASCPESYVNAVMLDDGMAIFGVSLVPPHDEVVYDWTVSAGSIVEGQGTATITVKADIGTLVVATVQIGGLDAGCADTGNAALEFF